MIEIDEKQLASKPKKVGSLHGKPVLQFLTKGGFVLNVVMKSGRPEYIGTGPHPAVCRHISKRNEPDVVWEELSKSDHVDPEYFQDLLPQYEELTKRLNELSRLV